MFIVVVEAVPKRDASEFFTVDGATVTVFTCMCTEDEAIEIAHVMIQDARWEIASIEDVFWAGAAAAADDEELARSLESARNDGPILRVEYHDAVAEGRSIH